MAKNVKLSVTAAIN